jgi:hypothetical protein
MDTRSRRAFAAYVVAIGLLPFNRRNPYAIIPNDAKARFLRALLFVGLTEDDASRSRAARVAGIPWGTVASWIHRDTEFKEAVSKVFQDTERELTDLETEPLEESDLEALERIQRLPEVELARIAVGEVPSRAFMAAAFPPGEDGAASAEHPDWLWLFPAGVSGEPIPAGRVQRPRALALVPDETAAPSEGNGQAGGPPEEESEPLPPPAAMDDGIQPDPTSNPTYYLPPSIRGTSGKQKPRRHVQRRRG